MNQKARQKATSLVEKDFYKLLNNSNFGIDCRNNIDNCYFEPLCDNFPDIIYIKRFTTIFADDTFSNFFSPCLLRDQIIQTFQTKISALNKEETTYEARKKYFERQVAEELDAVASYEKNRQVKKRKFKNVKEKTLEYLDPRKTKMVIDFNYREWAGIKSFAVKKKQRGESYEMFYVGQIANVP